MRARCIAARRWASLVKPIHALALLAATFFVVQLLLMDPQRFFGWDESIYLAEVLPNRPSIGWDAHRARGVPILIAPVALAAPAVTAVRVYMAAGTALLAFLAYACWPKMIGWGAVWSAAAFLFSWIALAQGHEVLPNIPAALCAVGVAGAFVGRMRGARTAASAIAVVGFGFALALLRPTETVPLAGVLALAGAWWTRASRSPLGEAVDGRRRLLVEELGLLATGMALGWGQWLVEAVTAFGGPLQRLRAAADILPGPPDSVVAMLWAYVQMMNGPWGGPDVAGLPSMALTWSAFVLVGCALAVIGRQTARSIGVTCLTASVALLAWYLAYDWIEVRFLAPAWALASVAVGIGYARVGKVMRSPRTVAVGVTLGGVVVAALLVMHVRVAQDVVAYQSAVAESDRAVGEAMQALADGNPCAFYTDYGAPQLELGSGCDGTWVDAVDVHIMAEITDRRQSGQQVFVALRQDPSAGSFFAAWDTRRIPAQHGPEWRLYIPPERVGARR